MKQINTTRTIPGILAVLGITAVLILSGCMSLSRAGEQEISDILNMINEGRNKDLSEISGSPFLLDGEILQGESLTGSFWAGLSDSGFKLTNAEITLNRMLTIDDMELFGQTFEIKIFLSKYITEHSVIVGIDSDEGKTYLILVPAEGGIRKIAAWGGPY